MPSHRYTIGQCKCGADLCCQTNGGDYEGPAYWEGGELGCLHVIPGCEFDSDIRYPEEVKMDHVNRQTYHKFPELRPDRINLDAVAHAAGFRKGLI